MQVVQKSSEQRRLELRTLNQVIAERGKYYRQQEALIADLIESGNTQLMSLNHDILLARQELRNIKTDIRTASQDKVLIYEDLEILRIEAGGVIGPTLFVGFTSAFGL